MMKNAIKMTMTALMLMVLGLTTLSAQAQEDSVTHDQAAVMIASLMGLYVGASDVPSSFEVMTALAAAGIQPSDEGWETGAVMTIAQFARVMVGALGLNDMVKNPSDSKSYISVLKGEGIGVEDISAGLDELRVPFNFFVNGIFSGVSSSDPLQTREIIGEPDEAGLGADLSGVALDINAPITAQQFAAAITILELAQPVSRRSSTTPN